MKFVWDFEKARSNRIKHGVDFQTAQRVWNDPFHLIVPDRVENGEERWHAIGMVGSIVILVVVHTYPKPDDELHIRIIGARKATAHERRRYEQEGT